MNCPRCEKPLEAESRFCRHCGAPAPSPEPYIEDDEVSIPAVKAEEILDRKWKIGRKLGRGGMGTVFLAHDLDLDRVVAVKFLASALCEDPAFVQRFEREAKLTAKLEHPNIVPVHAVGSHGGRPFIVMAYLEGRPLSEVIKRNPKGLPTETVLSLMRQICAGMAFIHEKGFVHRDVKPANLFVGAAGHVWILDFGLLRDATAEGLTRTGLVLGTPHYMSPEQARGGRDIDRRADLYALGIVLYEMLTGVRPFEADTDLSIIQMHAHHPPPDLARKAPWVPRTAGAVVGRALAKDPAGRFQSAKELYEAVHLALASGSEANTAAIPQANVGPASLATAPETVNIRPAITSTEDKTTAVFPRKKTVLIVDDSDVALQAAQIALEEAGYRVIALDNPLMINNAIRKDPPDLILLDINMPALNGDQVVEIASRHGTMGRTPVVLHSDLPERDLEERSKRCGAAGFIQKTSNENEFLKQVMRWVEP